jgi:hypothetical protein
VAVPSLFATKLSPVEEGNTGACSEGIGLPVVVTVKVT